jgi:hypothetical protein
MCGVFLDVREDRKAGPTDNGRDTLLLIEVGKNTSRQNMTELHNCCRWKRMGVCRHPRDGSGDDRHSIRRCQIENLPGQVRFCGLVWNWGYEGMEWVGGGDARFYGRLCGCRRLRLTGLRNPLGDIWSLHCRRHLPLFHHSRSSTDLGSQP